MRGRGFVLLLVLLLFSSFIYAEKNVALVENGGEPFAFGCSAPRLRVLWGSSPSWLGCEECLNDGNKYFGACQWFSYDLEPENPSTYAFGVTFPQTYVNKVILYQRWANLRDFNVEYMNSDGAWVVAGSYHQDSPDFSVPSTAHIETFTLESVYAKGIRIFPTSTVYRTPDGGWAVLRIFELEVYEGQSAQYDFAPEITVLGALCKDVLTRVTINSPDLEDFVVGYNLYLNEELIQVGEISSLDKRTEPIKVNTGIHNLRVVLDPENAIFETNEENNEDTTSFMVMGDCSDLKQQFAPKFQIRTASVDNKGEPIEWTGWMGPDCSTETFYTYSGQPVECEQHKGNKFVQIKAFMEATPEITSFINELNVSYSGTINQEPVVGLKASPQEVFMESSILGDKSGEVTLTANVADSDGEVVSYIWDLGDGNKDETAGNIVTHKYDDVGVYSVEITAVDDSGGKTTAKTKVYVSAYDCFESSDIGTGGNTFISSIDELSDADKMRIVGDVLGEYAEVKSIEMDEVDTTIEIYEAVAMYVSEHMGYYLSPVCSGYDDRNGVYYSAKNIYLAGMDENCQPCPEDFCGQCVHYSYFFTAVARLMGLSEKCVYSASSDRHAFNIINYLGKYRVYEPQSGIITGAFSSVNRNMLSCGPIEGLTCYTNYYGVTSIDYPSYVPHLVYNDIYGPNYRFDKVNYASNAYQYTLNNMDSSGMPDVSNRCPANYNPIGLDSRNMNAWEDWIELGSMTYYTDVCP